MPKQRFKSLTQLSLPSYVKIFPSVCVTRRASYTVSLLIDVAFCSIEELNVLITFLSIIFCQICQGRTYCRTEIVNWLW